MEILFQGDSVTDCQRVREDGFINLGLGHGYVNIIGSKLMCENPQTKIYNRGIAGNRILDMYARWEEACINIPCDILSILIGVNDIGFAIRLNCGTHLDKFKFVYDRILYETLERKPGIKIVLCQPFMSRVDCEAGRDIYKDWDIWTSHLKERSQVIESLAKEYKTVYVPLWDEFKKAENIAPAGHWSKDCIHPTHAGHQLIANKWLEYVKL